MNKKEIVKLLESVLEEEDNLYEQMKWLLDYDKKMTKKDRVKFEEYKDKHLYAWGIVYNTLEKIRKEDKKWYTTEL